MDCESCGRFRPSDQVVPTLSGNGTVVMLCGRCRRHVLHRAAPPGGLRPAPDAAREAAGPA